MLFGSIRILPYFPFRLTFRGKILSFLLLLNSAIRSHPPIPSNMNSKLVPPPFRLAVLSAVALAKEEALERSRITPTSGACPEPVERADAPESKFLSFETQGAPNGSLFVFEL
jgi:hypothetical protein